MQLPTTQADVPNVPNVYRRIQEVSARMAAVGLGKEQFNQQQQFRFRGIDGLCNKLSPVLATVGLVILPRLLQTERNSFKTQKGGTATSVVVEVEYELTAVSDGSSTTVRFPGEAVDYGDKGTGKAMTMAYKTMLLTVFCVPLDGDPQVLRDMDPDHSITDPAPPSDLSGSESAAPEKPSLNATAKAIRDLTARLSGAVTDSGVEKSAVAKYCKDTFGKSGRELCKEGDSQAVDQIIGWLAQAKKAA